MTHRLLAVAVALAPLAGVGQTLRVESEPAGAAVSVDGEPVGRTPVEVAVAPGARRVQLVLYAHAVWDEEVMVAGDGVTVVEADLRLAPGRVVVSDVPAGAAVAVDGSSAAAQGGAFVAEVGVAGAAWVDVVVEAPGQAEVRTAVRVRPGAETAVAYRPSQFRLDRVPLAAVPGGLQFASGRRRVGAFAVAAVAGGLGVAAAGAPFYDRAAADLEAASTRYALGTSEDAALESRTRVEATLRRGRRVRAVQNVALAVAAGAYLASVVDGLVRHGSGPGLSASPPATLSLAAPDAGLGARLVVSL